MNPIVVIPARMASTRLPGKPLAEINGKPMILHMLDRGREAAIGPVAVTDGRQDGALLPGSLPASFPTQQLVDEEVRRIVDEAERAVIELVTRERARLDALAHALLEHETLDQPEAYEVAGVEMPERDVTEEAKATATP